MIQYHYYNCTDEDVVLQARHPCCGRVAFHVLKANPICIDPNREELTAFEKTQVSCDAAMEFVLSNPERFDMEIDFDQNSKTLICLIVKNEKETIPTAEANS